MLCAIVFGCLLSAIDVFGLESAREVFDVVDCVLESDGADIPVTRCIGGRSHLNGLDPILNLDFLYTSVRKVLRRGYPLHPHAGYAELRIGLPMAASLTHRDGCGGSSVLHAGGSQLFFTGKGALHEEFYSPPGHPPPSPSAALLRFQSDPVKAQQSASQEVNPQDVYTTEPQAGKRCASLSILQVWLNAPAWLRRTPSYLRTSNIWADAPPLPSSSTTRCPSASDSPCVDDLVDSDIHFRRTAMTVLVGRSPETAVRCLVYIRTGRNRVSPNSHSGDSERVGTASTFSERVGTASTFYLLPEDCDCLEHLISTDSPTPNSAQPPSSEQGHSTPMQGRDHPGGCDGRTVELHVWGTIEIFAGSEGSLVGPVEWPPRAGQSCGKYENSTQVGGESDSSSSTMHSGGRESHQLFVGIVTLMPGASVELQPHSVANSTLLSTIAVVLRAHKTVSVLTGGTLVANISARQAAVYGDRGSFIRLEAHSTKAHPESGASRTAHTWPAHICAKANIRGRAQNPVSVTISTAARCALSSRGASIAVIAAQPLGGTVFTANGLVTGSEQELIDLTRELGENRKWDASKSCECYTSNSRGNNDLQRS